MNIRRKVYVALMLLLLASAGLAAQEAARPERNSRAKELKEKAAALIEQRKIDEAIAILQEAAKIEPGWSDIYRDLGFAYINRFFETRKKDFEEKAIAALNKAGTLDPKRPPPSWQLGVFAYQNKHYEDAIPYLGLAVKTDPKLTFGYTTYAYKCRWQAMLKRADFEKEIPVIRLEIEDLLNSTAERRAALNVAGQGYQAIGDEESLKRVDDLMLQEFPHSEQSQDILRRRALEETDEHKQAALIEDFPTAIPRTIRRVSSTTSCSEYEPLILMWLQRQSQRLEMSGLRERRRMLSRGSAAARLSLRYCPKEESSWTMRRQSPIRSSPPSTRSPRILRSYNPSTRQSEQG